MTHHVTGGEMDRLANMRALRERAPVGEVPRVNQGWALEAGERIAALERENEELRAEIARLKGSAAERARAYRERRKGRG